MVKASPDIEKPFDRLDEVLHDGCLEHDTRRTGLVALAFCDLLAGQLDSEQSSAVEAARRFWNGAPTDEYHRALSGFAKRVDADQKQAQANRRGAAINRLVWTALNANTGFSGLAGEFLVALGADAGLSAQEMAGALSRHVPGFEMT
jgi:hypothetical protein